MPRTSKPVREHLEKSRSAALAAVEQYNRPTATFRTRTYVMLMTVAWTSLFHAIFYKRKIKPWHRFNKNQKRIRYEYVDGEPRHWELSECLREFWGSHNPPQRANLRFFIGLRNKIEHRHAPELDPALYGECQAMLTSYEELLIEQFGRRYALTDTPGLALQFSALRPEAQIEAVRRLQKQDSKDLRQYIEMFRAKLPPEVLASSEYSLKVFLLPKLTNSVNAADLAIEFLNVDHLDAGERERVADMVALIKDRQMPVASAGLVKPGAVVNAVSNTIPFVFNMTTHTQCWRHFKVRPETDSNNPEATKSEYCVYDNLNKNYGYTEAWIEMLCEVLTDPAQYEEVTGKQPKSSNKPNSDG